MSAHGVAYAPHRIVRVILDSFLRWRGLRLAAPGLAPDEPPPVFDEDRIVSDMRMFFYVRIDAVREAPRGGRDWAVFLILSDQGKYALHLPDLRRLLAGIEGDRQAGRLDEVFVVAEDDFFGRKPLVDLIREAQRATAGLGADPEGVAPFYTGVPYRRLVCSVPDHASAQPHRVLPPEELAQVLADLARTADELPKGRTTDAPIVWIGGRAGQVVEILRDSPLAGVAPYWRQIVPGPY